MQKATINLETLACPSCIQKIEAAVKRLDGINKESVQVSFNSSRVRTDFDSEVVTLAGIEKAIEDLGYPVIKSRAKAV